MNDCVNFNERDGYCKALEGDCDELECSFRITKKQREERLKAWKERLRSLPTEVQKDIALKYYRGFEIWNEGDKK